MAAGLPAARSAVEAGNAEFIQRQLSGGERSIFVDPSKYMLDTANHLMVLVAERFELKLAGEHLIAPAANTLPRLTCRRRHAA